MGKTADEHQGPPCPREKRSLKTPSAVGFWTIAIVPQVLLIPDNELAARRQAGEDARLDAARAAMSEAERQATEEISARLREAQARPGQP